MSSWPLASSSLRGDWDSRKRRPFGGGGGLEGGGHLAGLSKGDGVPLLWLRSLDIDGENDPDTTDDLKH